MTDIDKLWWWHSIKFDDGRITNGAKSLSHMEREIANTFGPIDIKDKSVLDIGACVGGFSIEAHRRGAKRIVSLDHTVWNDSKYDARKSIELAAKECNADLELVDFNIDAPQMSLGHLGKFDVVLFLGVFYHLVDPIAALREICNITNEVLIIETEMGCFDSSESSMSFRIESTIEDNHAVWWTPNPRCMVDLLTAFGMKNITFNNSDLRRGVFHAYK